ncbi:MAG: aminopeptidase P family N-terminal domain-containing protein, partial [Paracoccaceae bacterium]|nr:aminopeptidase P family N-terminal domain-containing protein [Paracoccaceae bacterium]
MFQSFENASDPAQGPSRLARLRKQLQRNELDGFLVPSTDAHQGEYVAAHDARLSWLTGFTGSVGFCAALKDRAGVFVDGRYRVQVKQQVDACFTPVDWPETGLADWLLAQDPKPRKLGFDPWLHTISEVKTLRQKLTNQIQLIPVAENLIDRIWSKQVGTSNQPITAHPLEYAGESTSDKR